MSNRRLTTYRTPLSPGRVAPSITLSICPVENRVSCSDISLDRGHQHEVRTSLFGRRASASGVRG